MNNTRNLLIFLFLLAIFMGAGPGLHLINPDPLDPDADFLAFGLPVIYVWGLFWYVVQFAVILYAYKYLWRGGEDA
jgi:hypothetical protein|tara:strand:- start:196 stop:423 length:228 start_codon:yes stop_codon:yes gene_type:complete